MAGCHMHISGVMMCRYMHVHMRNNKKMASER